MMIKKYLLICFFLPIFSIIHGQTNNLIKDASGNLLPGTQYFCPGDVINLKIDANATATGDYTITKDLPAAYNISAGTTKVPFGATGTNLDRFSAPINLGFNFSFYGQTYTQVVAGINGRLVFTNGSDLAKLSDNTVYKDKTFTGDTASQPLATLPSPNYNQVYLNSANSVNLAQIFFGFTDMYHTANTSTQYNYKSVTVGGVQGLLVSYQNEIHGDSKGFSSTTFDSYVIMLADGRIIIYNTKKTETTYNAVLGIQNELGTKAKIPTPSNAAYNYNNGHWASEGVAWIFTPSQNLTPKIEWFLNGSAINTNPQPNNVFSSFKPNDGDILSANLSYVEDPTNVTSGSITFKNYMKPVISATPGTTCGSVTTLGVTNPQSNYTYTWTSDDPTFSATGTTAVATKSGNYYAIPNNCAVQKSDPITVNIASPVTLPRFSDGKIFPVCDNLNQTSKSVNLLQLVNYTPDAGSTVTFTDSAGNIVANANLTSGSTQNFKMMISSAACPVTRNFSVSYQSFPTDNFALTSPKKCVGAASYSVTDFKADFKDYENFDVAFSTDNVNFNQTSVNPSSANPVYVRLSKAGFSCTSSGSLKFDFYPPIQVATVSPFPAHCNSSTEYFDLNITKKELEYAPNITATFYSDALRTAPITNLNYRGSGTVYTKISDGNCSVDGPEINLVVYPKPALIKNGPEVKYSECGSSVFDLTTIIDSYIQNWQRDYEIRYFDHNGKQLSEIEWKNYNPDVSGNPYMQLIYNKTDNLGCSDIINFKLIKKEKPAATKLQIPICGQATYSLIDFENYITGNLATNYTFTDGNGNALPTTFDIKTSLPTVTVIITDNITGCKSDLQNVQFVKGNPTPVLTSTAALPAECLKNANVTFDLTKVETQIYNAKATFIFFDPSGNIINNPQNYQTNTSQVLNGTVSAEGMCPTSFTVTLVVNNPTVIQSSVSPELCYGDPLNIYINNFYDFQSVILHTPGGNITLNSNFYSIPYKAVQIGQRYEITAFNSKNCESVPVTFMPSDENQPKISQINQSDTQIEVIASGGSQPYTYFFNGLASTSNILQNPTADSYEIYVQSADGCRGPSKFVYNIVIKNVITPNGDGYNDTWTVKNLDKMENQEIIISDRYGKTLYHGTDKNSLVWDGTYNGRLLPTASYWYVVKWHDPATNKDEARTGWILLKNRE